jgi:hypothetical protein
MAPLGMVTGNPQMMNAMTRGPEGVFPTGYVEDFSRMPPPMQRMPPQVYDNYPGLPGEIIGERIDEPRVLETRQIGCEWVQSVKPFITTETMVEVPHTKQREITRHVPKPEIVERIIEVPKTVYAPTRTIREPKRIQHHEEKIREVDMGQITEVEQRKVPKKEVQERLIEIPKIEYREVIEYEDYVEYREVPVDKIIEVPQIEYVTREVERFVSQPYVQEYFVPKYTEVPVIQQQEVYRMEEVPVIQPVPRYRTQPVPVNVPVHTPTMRMGPDMQPGFMPPSMGGGELGMGGPPTMGGMGGMPTSYSAYLPNSYANYDPARVGMTASMTPAGPMMPGGPGPMMPPGSMAGGPMMPPGSMMAGGPFVPPVH